MAVLRYEGFDYPNLAHATALTASNVFTNAASALNAFSYNTATVYDSGSRANSSTPSTWTIGISTTVKPLVDRQNPAIPSSPSSLYFPLMSCVGFSPIGNALSNRKNFGTLSAAPDPSLLTPSVNITTAIGFWVRFDPNVWYGNGVAYCRFMTRPASLAAMASSSTDSLGWMDIYYNKGSIVFANPCFNSIYTQPLVTGTTQLNDNKWHWIEMLGFQYTWTQASTIYHRSYSITYIDGNMEFGGPVDEGLGNPGSTTAQSYPYVAFGSPWNGYTKGGGFWLDDLIIYSTGTADPNMQFPIGPQYISRVSPNANGSNSNFSRFDAGRLNYYEAMSATEYVSATTIGIKDTYKFPFSKVPKNIFGIGVNATSFNSSDSAMSLSASTYNSSNPNTTIDTAFAPNSVPVGSAYPMNGLFTARKDGTLFGAADLANLEVGFTT
jgi:hypothetical protein